MFPHNSSTVDPIEKMSETNKKKTKKKVVYLNVKLLTYLPNNWTNITIALSLLLAHVCQQCTNDYLCMAL